MEKNKQDRLLGEDVTPVYPYFDELMGVPKFIRDEVKRNITSLQEKFQIESHVSMGEPFKKEEWWDGDENEYFVLDEFKNPNIANETINKLKYENKN